MELTDTGESRVNGYLFVLERTLKTFLPAETVRDAVRETFGDEERRAQLRESTNIFRVLIKTLLHAGIITSRTAPLYGVWVDMEELKAEGDAIPGDVVADEMLVVLREINAKRRRIGAKDVTAAAS